VTHGHEVRLAPRFRTILVGAALYLVLSPACAQAQRDPGDTEAGTIYRAVLQALPGLVGTREVVVDPRVSRSFSDGATAVEVWEHHLSTAAAHPVIEALHQSVPGLKYCADTVTRSSCLGSTRYVHVTFSRAQVAAGDTASVEVTLVTRTSDDSNAIDIHTWRYSFALRESGPQLVGRTMLVRGHGRMGGADRQRHGIRRPRPTALLRAANAA
jgi:hypothetical protein